MARFRTACAVLMVLFAAVLAAAQTDWNAAHDWAGNANPSGAWTYGYKTASATGAFAAYPNYLNPATGFPQRDEWSGSNTSAVFHNAAGFGGDIPTNMLVLLPDAGGFAATVRWTAPAAGAYVLQGQFNALGASHAQVSVVSNGSTVVTTQTLSGGSSAAPFTVYVNAAANATVDFVVAGSAGDSTGLNATVHRLQLNGSTNSGTPAVLKPFNYLSLTDAQFQAATAWLSGRQWVADGFDTTFTYQVNNSSSSPADGFTFTIQNDPKGATFLGDGGGNLSVNNLTHALTVEFDDFANDAADGPAPHLAVLTAGTGPLAVDPECTPAPCTATANGYTITTLGKFNYANFNPAFVGTHQVRVKYVAGASPAMYVYLDSASGGHGVLDGNAPVLTMPVNLQSLLGLSAGTATIGFSGGTGFLWEQAQIGAWQFASFDITPPVVSPLADILMEANDLGGAHVSYALPTATDAQDGARPVSCSPAAGSLFVVGKTTVQCSAMDLSGNQAQTSFNVTVTDTTPPALALPANITAEATSASGAAASYIATATDIVDGNVTPLCAPASGSAFALGTTAVNCTATDAHNNQSSGSFTVTVVDTTAPTISGMPSNMTVEATGPSGAVATWNAPAASDLVDGSVAVSCNPVSGSTFALGTTAVTCTATDAHKNSSSATFTITVRDTTPPALTLPANMTVEATSASGATVSYAATATDLVDLSVATVCNPLSGSVFAIGATTVTCTATDAAHNQSSSSFTVTVVDTTPPAISGMPSNLTVEATGPSGAAATWNPPTASDLVDGSVSVLCSPASGSTFALGTTAVTCTATDAHHNASSASFSVTVVDTTAPAISGMPSNLTVEATSAAGAVANWAAPTSTDLVDGNLSVTCAPASGSTFALGTTAVTCTATDAHKNSSSASFNVTVVDTTAPAISGMPSNMTLEATGPAGAIATWTSPAANDLVDGSVPVACAPASGSTFALGTTTVTCTATDVHHNSSSAAFSVTVRDTTAPSLHLPANMTATATSAAGANVSFSATATDLVDGTDPVLCSPASGALFPVGTTTVNCTATDAHGNTASGSFSVTVVQTYFLSLLYDPNQAKQSGSAYPIVLQVLDGSGRNVSSSSLMLQATGVMSLTGGTPGPLADAGGSNPGMFFRYDPTFQGYIFNLKLTGYSGGGYNLLFSVASTTGQAAPFSVSGDSATSQTNRRKR